MNDELKRIWDYCDKEQKRIDENENSFEGSGLSQFEQGLVIAYRHIQWEINKKCS